MPILPQNTDPSKDYVTQGVNPALTIDGVVYNKIYPHTGVIDALSNVENTGYSDPNLNIISSANIVAFNQELQTSWISDTDFGGPTSNPVVLTYSLVNTTYYNNISLDILNVPCYVELLDQNMNPLVGTSSFTIGGGNDIYTTTNWVTLSYTAPATNTGIGAIILRITRNKTVQISNNGILSNAAYSVGVQNFSIKLVVENKTDIPAAVASGTASIITQNRFGFRRSIVSSQ